MDKSATSKISGRKNLLLLLAKVLVLLMESALKMEVSIPALDRMVLIHPAMVELDARRCGFVNNKNTAASPVESEPIILRVLSTYPCNVKVGHMFWFTGKARKKYSFMGLLGWHCLGEADVLQCVYHCTLR